MRHVPVGLWSDLEHLEHPPEELWTARREWFEQAESLARGEGSYIVSEQACALTAEVQACFCVGAWVSVIILAMAVVDAALREVEMPEFNGNSQRLIEALGANPELQKLRRSRNAFVHLRPGNPSITVDQQWADRGRLEAEARRAVELMFEAFYFGPWV